MPFVLNGYNKSVTYAQSVNCSGKVSVNGYTVFSLLELSQQGRGHTEITQKFFYLSVIIFFFDYKFNTSHKQKIAASN